MKKETALGLTFLILGIAGIIIPITYNAWRDLFWLSNHWAIINGIGFPQEKNIQ